MRLQACPKPGSVDGLCLCRRSDEWFGCLRRWLCARTWDSGRLVFGTAQRYVEKGKLGTGRVRRQQRGSEWRLGCRTQHSQSENGADTKLCCAPPWSPSV